MDKFSYGLGLGMAQNLRSMGAGDICLDDFIQALRDVFEGNPTVITFGEARDIGLTVHPENAVIRPFTIQYSDPEVAEWDESREMIVLSSGWSSGSPPPKVTPPPVARK